MSYLSIDTGYSSVLLVTIQFVHVFVSLLPDGVEAEGLFFVHA
jgi:hypothetical protein